MPSTKSWQPDFSIYSDDETNSVDKNLAEKIREIEGVTNVFGNMVSIDEPATSEIGISEVTLVSYDEYMLKSAKECKVSGDFSKLSGDSNYVLTIYDARNPLEVGDKIQVNGIDLEVAGIVSAGLFADDITLICTEETFERLMGESNYALLNIQASDNVDKDKLIESIRNLMSENYSLADYYNINNENTAEFWAFRIVVYVFLAIIVLMAALNIINSTSMSVSAKIKQYGTMRAIGMEERQLIKMIMAEVLTYATFGCVIGCTFGLYLNKTIYESFITAYYGEMWNVPVGKIAIILAFTFASAAIAIRTPTKRISNMPITATINEL
jgi:putative ABC transport system permease protein